MLILDEKYVENGILGGFDVLFMADLLYSDKNCGRWDKVWL